MHDSWIWESYNTRIVLRLAQISILNTSVSWSEASFSDLQNDFDTAGTIIVLNTISYIE